MVRPGRWSRPAGGSSVRVQGQRRPAVHREGARRGRAVHEPARAGPRRPGSPRRGRQLRFPHDAGRGEVLAPPPSIPMHFTPTNLPRPLNPTLAPPLAHHHPPPPPPPPL